MMRGSSKGGRRRPFRCLPHTLGLLLFMAYWTAAFSAVLATGQTQVASNEMRKGGQQQIGVGGGPPGITVAMSPGLPSSSCQLALASLKVHLLSSYMSTTYILLHTICTTFGTVSPGTMYISTYLCTSARCKLYSISYDGGSRGRVRALGKE